MVAGRVISHNANLKPVVELLVYGHSEARARVQAIVDTGFTEQLTLPANAISKLGLPFEHEENLTMANDQPVTFQAFNARVEWNGQIREVKVLEAEGDPLIGMAMLRDHDLHIRAITDGNVSIESIA